MRKIIILLLFIGGIFSCKENSPKNMFINNLEKYVTYKFPELDKDYLTKFQQIIVVPNTGCNFCVTKGLELICSLNSKNILGITNFPLECEHNNFLFIEGDELNRLNIDANNKPVIFQISNNKTEIIHLSSQNWEEVFEQVIKFDEK